MKQPLAFIILVTWALILLCVAALSNNLVNNFLGCATVIVFWSIGKWAWNNTFHSK